jgi:hypothetical protein
MVRSSADSQKHRDPLHALWLPFNSKTTIKGGGIQSTDVACGLSQKQRESVSGARKTSVMIWVLKLLSRPSPEHEMYSLWQEHQKPICLVSQKDSKSTFATMICRKTAFRVAYVSPCVYQIRVEMILSGEETPFLDYHCLWNNSISTWAAPLNRFILLAVRRINDRSFQTLHWWTPPGFQKYNDTYGICWTIVDETTRRSNQYALRVSFKPGVARDVNIPSLRLQVFSSSHSLHTKFTFQNEMDLYPWLLRLPGAEF